jgi:ribonuclease Z
MAQTTITILGKAAVLPVAGEDSASFLVNGRYLFDTGWYAALKMQQYGCDPLAVEYLFLTHCHHDHYMGLPGLLFYRAMKGRSAGLAPLKIVGPRSDLQTVVERARAFLQVERFPEVDPPVELFPLSPGETFRTEAFSLETAPARHSVEAMIGRFTDRQSGAVFAFSGDTGINPEMVSVAQGASLLIHEASLRPEATESDAKVHSRAVDAARAARDAGVGQLRLIHLHGDHAERSLAAAREVFPETELAAEGETLLLGGR